MNDPLGDNNKDPVLGEDHLHELERNTLDAIRRDGSRERVAIKSRIVIQPGNSSDLLSLRVQGVTGDISPSGLHALLPVPLKVGDAYRVTFDRNEVDLPLTFVRCLQCRLIREDAYESSFSFFTPVSLSGLLKSGAGGRVRTA